MIQAMHPKAKILQPLALNRNFRGALIRRKDTSRRFLIRRPKPDMRPYPQTLQPLNLDAATIDIITQMSPYAAAQVTFSASISYSFGGWGVG